MRARNHLTLILSLQGLFIALFQLIKRLVHFLQTTTQFGWCERTVALQVAFAVRRKGGYVDYQAT